MNYDHILVRYGELTLKGANRKKFVNCLKDNVNKALKSINGTHVMGKRDRMYIDLEEETDCNEVIQRLTQIYGIKSVSPVLKTGKTVDEINQLCIK